MKCTSIPSLFKMFSLLVKWIRINMVTQKEIESDWTMHRLLITGNVNRKYLAFCMGQHSIYLQDFSPLIPKRHRPIHVTVNRTPHVAIVRTPFSGNVYQFIREAKEFKAHIIRYKTLAIKDLYTKFATDCMGELIPECDGYTVRITSNDKEVRETFYQFADEAAKKTHLGVRFDYELYDFDIDIRAYKLKSGGHALVVTQDFIHKPISHWNTSTYIHPKILKYHQAVIDDDRETTLEEDADPEVLQEMERKWKDS